MRVTIDDDLCTACGLCTDSLPEVFQMDEDVARVIQETVSGEFESSVQDAASDCPVEAILLTG